MTSEEAKEALKAGKKVRHKSWCEQLIEQETRNIYVFDNVRFPVYDNFYKDYTDEWEIVE